MSVDVVTDAGETLDEQEAVRSLLALHRIPEHSPTPTTLRQTVNLIQVQCWIDDGYLVEVETSSNEWMTILTEKGEQSAPSELRMTFEKYKKMVYLKPVEA